MDRQSEGELTDGEKFQRENCVALDYNGTQEQRIVGYRWSPVFGRKTMSVAVALPDTFITSTGMTTTMFDTLPAAFLTVFLAGCVLWLIWQVFRRLFSTRKRRVEPSLADEPGNSRIEPAVTGTAAAVSTIPDAADVLALKAAIDNLARQVAALEQRLAAGQTSLIPQPLPRDRSVDQSPVIPPVSPDHRI